MFEFLKSAATLEQDLRDWMISDFDRILGHEKHLENKASISDRKLVELLVTAATHIQLHVSDENMHRALYARSMDPALTAHYKRGAKFENALLKKLGLALSIDPNVGWSGAIIVVDEATKQRVTDATSQKSPALRPGLSQRIASSLTRGLLARLPW